MRTVILSIMVSMLVLSMQSDAKTVPEPKDDALPEDFSLIHKEWDIGVLPRTTRIIEIQKDPKSEEGGYIRTMRTHTSAVGDEPEAVVWFPKQRLTKAQCLSIYQQAVKLGFFNLKDSYETEESGGGAESLSITANGKTKTVAAFNTDVSVIKALLAKIMRT